MSKPITADNLLSVFPRMLAQDTHLYALASGVATELQALFNNNDLLGIYTRIDELDGALLDILAYDFKVDWWDANYTIEEKRATFKAHWQVHRTLGTPGSVTAAVSAIFENVKILEWWQYNGTPYRFKLLIDTGELLPNYDKLQSVIERVKYYKNLRSILESIIFSAKKTTEQVHFGAAVHLEKTRTMRIEVFDWMFVDELEDELIDELDQDLID